MTRQKFLKIIVIGQALLIIALIAVLFYKKKAAKNLVDDAATDIRRVEPQTEQTATLGDALQIARDGLQHMRENLIDYRARMVKRERIDGKLADESEMQIKVQCRRTEGDITVASMRVYLKFTRPDANAGREVIWAEDQQDGKLVAHEPGLLNLAQATLDPTSAMAMKGNLYPITEIGMFNLVRQLIHRGENDFKDSQVEVEILDDQEFDSNLCQLIRITHLENREDLTFKVAEILIDVKRQIPLRYAAFGWPETPDAPLPLLEEYSYMDVETNVGLTDADFDPGNEAYNFPMLKVSL